MPLFKKKPVVIEAYKFDGSNHPEILYWSGQYHASAIDNKRHIYWNADTGNLEINTLEGIMKAIPGDYIIKGVSNEFYPCKPDIFEKTYSASLNTPDNPIPDNLKVIIEALRADKTPGSYYHSWQANIAMAFKDEWDRQSKKKDYARLNTMDVHEVANTAAKNFLDLLCR